MTALKEYQRLEAAGQWRARPEDQRRDVIVSIGDATLTITNMKDQPLAHWSLAAVERKNPGQYPATYHPNGDPGETLELEKDETTMLDAIEKLRLAIEGARPHPGRLRSVSLLGSLGLIAALLVVWMPGAMIRHTLSVVPEIKRREIGQSLLGHIERVSGQACTTPETTPILARLATRTGARKIVVLRAGVTSGLHLPGGIILLNRSLIENHEDPAVAAGAVLVERARAQAIDPLGEMLSSSGVLASFRLLTTGKLGSNSLGRYAETMVSVTRPKLPDENILAIFAQAAIPSTPYAYAQDISGEDVLGLIEADPMAGRVLEPVMNDRDWVQLQNICS